MVGGEMGRHVYYVCMHCDLKLVFEREVELGNLLGVFSQFSE